MKVTTTDAKVNISQNPNANELNRQKALIYAWGRWSEAKIELSALFKKYNAKSILELSEFFKTDQNVDANALSDYKKYKLLVISINIYERYIKANSDHNSVSAKLAKKFDAPDV